MYYVARSFHVLGGLCALYAFQPLYAYEALADNILGKWKVVACERAENPDEACEAAIWSFSADNDITVTEGDDKWMLKVTMLDMSTTPWRMDWQCDDPARRFFAKGIVRCDGTSLQICGTAGDNAATLERPREFKTTKSDKDRIMCTFTRINECCDVSLRLPSGLVGSCDAPLAFLVK